MGSGRPGDGLSVRLGFQNFIYILHFFDFALWGEEEAPGGWSNFLFASLEDAPETQIWPMGNPYMTHGEPIYGPSRATFGPCEARRGRRTARGPAANSLPARVKAKPAMWRHQRGRPPSQLTGPIDPTFGVPVGPQPPVRVGRWYPRPPGVPGGLATRPFRSMWFCLVCEIVELWFGVPNWGTKRAMGTVFSAARGRSVLFFFVGNTLSGSMFRCQCI